MCCGLHKYILVTNILTHDIFCNRLCLHIQNLCNLLSKHEQKINVLFIKLQNNSLFPSHSLSRIFITTYQMFSSKYFIIIPYSLQYAQHTTQSWLHTIFFYRCAEVFILKKQTIFMVISVKCSIIHTSLESVCSSHNNCSCVFVFC